MKAFIRNKYGGPEVLKLTELEKPAPNQDEILVNIKAVSVNPADWHILRASPMFVRFSTGLLRPSNKIIGADFSGVVESIGSEITGYKVGDEVFGESSEGCFAEFNCIKATLMAKKPANASHNEAACLGIAGLTALQGVRDHAQVKTGDKVLINGASGGVGHFCVQLAKFYGAEVTAICSGKNHDLVKSLGADKLIDYQKTDIHKHKLQYDVVLDIHGNLSYSDHKRMSTKETRNVVIGFVGMGHMMSVMLKSVFGNKKIISFTAKANAKDLAELSKLVEAEKIKVHIDQQFSFIDLPKAISYIERMRTRGKVAISLL